MADIEKLSGELIDETCAVLGLTLTRYQRRQAVAAVVDRWEWAHRMKRNIRDEVGFVIETALLPYY